MLRPDQSITGVSQVRNGIGYLPAATQDVRLEALQERRNVEDVTRDGVQ